MKTSLLFYVCFAIASTGYTRDKIYLTNGKTLRCEIVTVEWNKLEYRQRGKIAVLHADDVALIELDAANIEVIEKINVQIDPRNPLASCEMGKADANAFHNRGFGNFALGFFFGPFGVLGTAIGAPRSPDYVKIPVKENLSDPAYLKCYRKRARGKNVLHAAAGWAGILLLSYLANN